MADLDVRALTKKVEDLNRTTNNLVRVLEALNENFVAFIRDFRKAQEREQNGQ